MFSFYYNHIFILGTAVVLVGQPMDTVKVKMQTFGHLYKNVWHCVTNTFRQEGVRKGEKKISRRLGGGKFVYMHLNLE